MKITAQWLYDLLSSDEKVFDNYIASDRDLTSVTIDGSINLELLSSKINEKLS